MCGIFCVMNDQSNKAAQTVLEGLQKLEYRGYDSWGIALLQKQMIAVDKHVGKIGSAHTNLPSGVTAIGHTRWATHGGVSDENAHPHLDCSGLIAVVHNGIVENHSDLKAALTRKGHVFQSETDTEIISHLIEEEKKIHPIPHAVFQAFAKLAGSNAIVVLDTVSQSIIACRNGSPLVLGLGKKQFFLSSDVTAFPSPVKRLYYLQDNEAIVLSLNKKQMVFSLGKEKKKKVSLTPYDWKKQQADKGAFAHFLIKEISEQTSVLPKALSTQRIQNPITSYLTNGYFPVFIGCGTAFYCGLAATYVFAHAGFFSQAVGAYEVKPLLPLFPRKTLIVAISQSGETADTLDAVRHAKKQGFPVVALINVRSSSLERLADHTIPVQAGPEIAVVSTKAFTAQLGTLFSILDEKKTATLVTAKLKKWLTPSLHSKMMILAKKLLEAEHAYIVGKHINYAGALEFALKLKETSYLHAEAFSAGEPKHGVIALIQKRTPCFILTDNGPSLKEICSSAAELKARGAYIIGVGPTYMTEFDEWVQTPNIDYLYSIFFNVIIGQLLGYYLGIGRGADPDKPRNLAKSVTVK